MSSETPPDDSPRRHGRGGAERAAVLAPARSRPRLPFAPLQEFVARRKAEGGAPTDF